MEVKPYESSAEVLTDRMEWACLRLSHAVQRGRAAGWLDGAALTELPDVATVEEHLANRLAVSEHHVQTFALQWAAVQLGLHRSQLDALWLLACVELDPSAACIASTFGGTLTLTTLVHVLAVSPAEISELADLGLIEIATERHIPMHQRWVRCADRTIDLARGEVRLDRELARFCELAVPREYPGIEIPEALERAFAANPAPRIVAYGTDGSGRATLLAALASRHGVGVLRVRAQALGSGSELLRRLRAVKRECALFGVVPLFHGAEPTSLLDEDLDHSRPLLIVASAEARLDTRRVLVTHAMKTPNITAREQIWRAALPDTEDYVIREVSTRYATVPGTILAAADAARAGAEGGKLNAEDVHRGLRAYLDGRLADIATRVACTQTWDDLVLPPEQYEQIVELIARVRHRRQVLDDWGFADKVGRGIGIAALLSGPPGTGKTMVAGLLAKELGLDLYQVDLSRIVSRYIGETEKNLARVFDAAEAGHAILLFDEADSLFAKRSEVKSSNDRYANLEVNFLLQRIEQFTGISLLTTNHERNIDEAFRRRLAVHVRFTAPDIDQREELWRSMLPSRAKVAPDLDFRQLAENLEMSGGYIKNATLRAAYFAAHDDEPISMHHLWRAARAECEAMGKLAFTSS